jgi:hypothetical protein
VSVVSRMVICEQLFVLIFPLLVLTSGKRYGKTENLQISEPKHNMTKRDISPQIIGGSMTPVKTAVAIFIQIGFTKDYQCAGTLISDNIVITAAHCMKGVGSDLNAVIEKENMVIVAGESNLRPYFRGESRLSVERGVKSVKIHPNFHAVPGKEYHWDMALLELDESIEMKSNPNIEAAVLPPPAIRHTGKEIRVGGWGKTGGWSQGSADHFAIDMTVKDGQECLEIFSESEFFTDRMFCSGRIGMTTCDGDSGAGAIFKGWGQGVPIILRVVSFGKTLCTTATGYLKIERALDWIFKETKLK